MDLKQMSPNIATSRQPEGNATSGPLRGSPTVTGSFLAARQEIDRLITLHERHVAEHEEAISRTRSKLAELRDIREKLGAIGEGPDTSVPEDFGKRKKNRAGSLAWTIRRKAYVILKEVGYPLDRTELLERLNGEGVLLERADAAKVIGKTLWAAEEFVTVERGYWLADEPLPEAEEIPQRRKRKWGTKKRSD